MGTSLNGKQVNQTFDSLIKVGDNDAITSTKKRLSDGLGNDLPIELSSTEVDMSLASKVSGSFYGDGSNLTGVTVGGKYPVVTYAGRVQTTSTTDTRMFVAGGGLGQFYYIWGSTVSTINLEELGTPDTTTKSVTTYTAAQGMIRVPRAGTVVIDGWIEPDSGYANTNWWIHCWKFSDTFKTNSIIGGTYDNLDTTTLKASAAYTAPASLPHLTMKRFISTNGTSVAEDDYIFCTISTDATTSSGTDYSVVSVTISLE